MRPALTPGEHSALVRKAGGEFIIVTSRGHVLPVTNWIAPNGSDAEDQADAAMCVCGSEFQGWYTITLLGGFMHAH